MNLDIEELKNIKKEFLKIKKKDYIKIKGTNPIRNSLTEELNTFVDLISKNKRALKWLGQKDVALKINKELTRNYIKIMSVSPTGDNRLEVLRLKDKYGYCLEGSRKKILNCSIQANCNTLVGGRYQFRLEIDYIEEKIYLAISDKSFNRIEKKVFWTFEDLKKRLSHKYNYFVLIKAWAKIENKELWCKYYDIEFLKFKDFYMFLKLLEEGTIRVTFKVKENTTSYRRRGEVIDYGTTFEIQELDMPKLFNKLNI